MSASMSGAAATKSPSGAKVFQGCLVLLGLMAICSLCGMLSNAVRTSLTPPAARTATAAARETSVAALLATWTPRPTKTAGPTEWPTMTPRPKPTEYDPKAGVTLANFNRIQTGMSYDQVRDILNAPGEVASESDLAGYHTIMYSWVGPGFSNMTAMFQNGALVSKAQAGLR